MNRRRHYSISRLVSFSLGVVFLLGTAHAQESLDQLHKKALQEGGTLTFYGTLAQINAEKVLPAFEKRFPGLKVNHVDATADKLIARAITEARGGKTFVDVFQLNLENLGQANDQGLLVEQFPFDELVDQCLFRRRILSASARIDVEVARGNRGPVHGGDDFGVVAFRCIRIDDEPCAGQNHG